MVKKFKFKLGFIGSGNMASAIALRLLGEGAIATDSLLMCDTSKEKLSVYSALGVATTNNCESVAENCATVFLAVKPQALKEVIEVIKPKLNCEILISMLAGVKISTIKAQLGDISPDIIRIMPNLACRFGNGMVLVNFGEVGVINSKTALQYLQPLGKCEEINEKRFNSGTAISGCGPAFFYTIFQAMINAAIDLGFDRETATKLVLQTAFGAATMAESSKEKMDVLIDRVCSKGGATIEGVNILNVCGIDEIINNAMNASKHRCDELETL